jgi:single-stranded DNA-binding protein
VQSRTSEKDGKKEYLVEIIAEKVTFLSSKKRDEKAD